MKICQICKQKTCGKLIDFGKHPVCHKFTDGKEKEELYPLDLGQCHSCGLVQLMSPIPVSKLVPLYDWITYNEPEEHLDHLVDIIKKLPGITKDSAICGVSYKEDTTLTRFNQLEFKNTWRVDMNKDLGISDTKSNLESIQQNLRPSIINSIHKKYGVPDLIIVRHILEHTHDTLEFMSALKKLVNPSGYIIFEVPDCVGGFEKFDYTTIWEEHILYFTNSTFKMCLETGKFSIHHFEKYDYSFESVLIGIVKPNNVNNKLKSTMLEKDILTSEIKRVQLFAQKLTQKKIDVKKFLEKIKRKKDNVVMFGTGHAACMFINLLEVRNLIDFAVDDNQNKRGFYMPGSKLPIYNSQSLIENKTNLCLLGLSSESEKKIVNKLQGFEERGGVFASIYPTSKYSMQI